MNLNLHELKNHQIDLKNAGIQALPLEIQIQVSLGMSLQSIYN